MLILCLNYHQQTRNHRHIPGGCPPPPYLAVATVDERSFGQQVAEQLRQVFVHQGEGKNLSHPAGHIHHGLMRVTHFQSSVASFKPDNTNTKTLAAQHREEFNSTTINAVDETQTYFQTTQ